MGGHKIYLRRYAQAALYPAFLPLAFLPVLIALVELVVYVFTSEDKLNERYGKVFSAPPSKLSIAWAVLILAAMAAVLFGIFVPEYRDQLARSRIAQTLAAAKTWQDAITGHYEKRRGFPSSPADLVPSPPAASDTGGYGAVALGANGALTLTLSSKTTGLEGQTMIFNATPDAKSGSLTWDCTGGSLEMRLRPAKCRR